MGTKQIVLEEVREILIFGSFIMADVFNLKNRDEQYKVFINRYNSLLAEKDMPLSNLYDIVFDILETQNESQRAVGEEELNEYAFKELIREAYPAKGLLGIFGVPATDKNTFGIDVANLILQGFSRKEFDELMDEFL